MKEFKEKPKLGKAKEKPKSALLPRQAVHMMKEKYIKEMDQRPKEAGGSTQQAPDQVEHAGRWAADELTGRPGGCPPWGQRPIRRGCARGPVCS